MVTTKTGHNGADHLQHHAGGDDIERCHLAMEQQATVRLVSLDGAHDGVPPHGERHVAGDDDGGNGQAVVVSRAHRRPDDRHAGAEQDRLPHDPEEADVFPAIPRCHLAHQ